MDTKNLGRSGWRDRILKTLNQFFPLSNDMYVPHLFILGNKGMYEMGRK
jgi:hypothetical protein